MNKTLLYVIAAVVVLGAVVLVVTRYSGSPAPAVQPQNPSPAAQVPAASTNAPTIAKAVMSRSIDTKGNATGVATTFNAKTDKIVYAVLTLKNISKGTKLSYVRYLNNKYVDSKVAVTTKDNLATFYFSFEKGIGDYPKGNYALNLYINGKKSQSVNYVFN